MTSTPTIAAVIVTFNRVEKLRKVMDALMAQTITLDRIMVVDNASTDGTDAYLQELQAQEPRVTHIRLPENIGGAGGFHEGTKAAYEAGADYIWLSDDDAYPQPGAIAALVHGIQDFEARYTWRPTFACSRVRWTNGDMCEMNTPSPQWDWPRFLDPGSPYALVNACSFVSVLVPRWAVAQHGYPIKDYFIWYDDVEFTQRLAKTYPGLLCINSDVIHDIPENKGVNYSLITEHTLWKYLYGARNEASFRKREQGWIGVLIFLRGVWNQMSDGKLPWSIRRRVLRSLLRGAFFKPEIVRPTD